MKGRGWAALVAAVLMVGAVPAEAHRLDEYLQATTIDLARDGITLRVRLTPGVDVAERVIGQIDRNGDGILSPDEQRIYAERIARNLSLSLNGKSVFLHPAGGAFPTIDAMKGGSGMIEIGFDVKARLGNGHDRLVYSNRGSGSGTVWLVNCLLPRDPSIHVLGQARSVDQSSYQLDVLLDDRDSGQGAVR